MASHDPRVDAYIASAADFARPILDELRKRVHAACPNVEEAIKWGMPGFSYAGSLLCGMGAFKRHVAFGYWKHALVMDGAERDGMGSYGKLASVGELPTRTRMQADLKKAMRLNEEGVKPAGSRKPSAPPMDAPADMVAALKKNRRAKAAFDGFPPSAQREYIDWIVEAKREDTRARRLAQAVEWMAEGKRRNWKYERC